MELDQKKCEILELKWFYLMPGDHLQVKALLMTAEEQTIYLQINNDFNVFIVGLLLV